MLLDETLCTVWLVGNWDFIRFFAITTIYNRNDGSVSMICEYSVMQPHCHLKLESGASTEDDHDKENATIKRQHVYVSTG